MQGSSSSMSYSEHESSPSSVSRKKWGASSVDKTTMDELLNPVQVHEGYQPYRIVLGEVHRILSYVCLLLCRFVGFEI